jgi:signal transduction histidine kinase
MDKQKRFISDAAHEVKTPLTAMKTGLEVTLRDKNLNLTEAKQILISTIEEVDKLNTLTSNLLKQSRYRYGNGNHTENIALDILITSIVSKYSEHSKDKNNSEIELELQPAIVKGNEEALRELFTNLIENALKYGKSKKPIQIKLNKDKSVARVDIRDFGKGIPAEDLPCIFEPFFRADKSRTDSVSEGYGLGVASVKEIVDGHNGKITVESKPNRGTIFTVTLPLNHKIDNRSANK